jgi:transcriptional regulator with XRE-family HTH domain
MNLMNLRRKKGWTQGQLSDACGVKVGHISKLERGHDTDPKLSTITRLMRALDCTADDLLLDTTQLGPTRLLRTLFHQAEQLPEEKQMVILEIVDGYCASLGMRQLLGNKPVMTLSLAQMLKSGKES